MVTVGLGSSTGKNVGGISAPIITEMMRWNRVNFGICEIAVRMAHAQELAGNFWMLEQPATSLMWLYAPLFELQGGPV